MSSLKRRSKILVSLIACICTVFVIGLGTRALADSRYKIMQSNTVTIGQMINFYQTNASYPAYYGGSDAPRLYDFCAMYYEECAAEGVDVCVAFSQAMVETGFLRFGGNVSITQFNFGGIDARAGIAGRSYSSVRQGIRAQVQRLKIYASTAGFNLPKAEGIDEALSKLSYLRGTKQYVEDLNTWGGSDTYYQAVLAMMSRLKSASSYTTWYNGTDYSSIYDPYYYAGQYSDVRNAYGNSGDGLISHFLNFGIYEGRRGSTNFDVYSYRRQYSDLRRAFGKNLASYYKHYVNYGQYEGRAGTGCTRLLGGTTEYNGVDYSAVYSYDYYSGYGDLSRAFGEDEDEMISHFVNFGMREGRQAISTFDVKSYKLQYADLRAAFGSDLQAYYRHYMNYGRREGRAGTGCTTLQGGVTSYNGVDYSAVYSYDYYSGYGDLKRAFGDDDVAMLSHFVNFGMREGRQGKSTFSVTSYKLKYADLRSAFGNDLPAYYRHYMNFGRYEGRAGTGCTSLVGATTVYNGVNYSDVYDYNVYSTYGDLKRAFGDDDVAMLSHFVDFGMSEGRQAKSTFNVRNYMNRYGDLRAAFGNNLKEYYLHYIEFGKNEGRNAA